MTEPKPTADLDDALKATLRQQKRDRWIVFVVVAVVLGLMTWLVIVRYQDQARNNHDIVAELNRASKGECEFFQTLGDTPPAGNVTKLGVQILAESRSSFVDLQCAGQLDPASPELIAAARKFDVPLTTKLTGQSPESSLSASSLPKPRITP